MGKLFISEHPLIQHKMTLLRNKETGTKEFKELIGEVAILLTYEATGYLPLEDIEVETPIEKCSGKTITKKLAVVPILRAGVGMSDAINQILPTAKIGHIGLYRDPKRLTRLNITASFPAT